MRIVVDTNVIISGLNFPGREREVLDLARIRRYELYLSPFITPKIHLFLLLRAFLVTFIPSPGIGVAICRLAQSWNLPFSSMASLANEAIRMLAGWATIVDSETRVQQLPTPLLSNLETGNS